jgi:aspartate racemase
MPATHPVLGIIGGMGPDGTLELMRRIVARTPAADDRDHLHMIVESNPKIPSRIAHLVERTGEDPTPEIVRIARNLERAGATALAMPCNTAHGYADAIRAGVAIPLLDMIALTTAHLARAVPGRRIGLLASTAVYNTRLYERALDASDACIVPPPDQHAVMELIRGVKRGDTRELYTTHDSGRAIDYIFMTPALAKAAKDAGKAVDPQAIEKAERAGVPAAATVFDDVTKG